MADPIEVLICGGGAIAHTLAAVIATMRRFNVTVLTRQPDHWGQEVLAVHGDVIVKGPVTATSDARVAGNAQLVIVAAPAYAHPDILGAIGPHLRGDAYLGALPAVGGFDILVRHLALCTRQVFGSLRAPYNARVIEPGKLVEVYGVLPRLQLVVPQASNGLQIQELLDAAFGLPSTVVTPFLCATLSPGGTIFHSARVFELVKTKEQGTCFYSGWGECAGLTYLSMDRELTRLRTVLRIDSHGVDATSHYGTRDPDQLAQKIRSIRGLPLVEPPFTHGRIDWRHRFIREDVPYGLKVVQHVAAKAKVSCPTIDEVTATILAEVDERNRTRLGLPSYIGAASLEALLA